MTQQMQAGCPTGLLCLGMLVLGGPPGVFLGFLPIQPLPRPPHQLTPPGLWEKPGICAEKFLNTIVLKKRCIYPVLPLFLWKWNTSRWNDFHSFHEFGTSVIRKGFSPQSRRGGGDFSEHTFRHVSLLLLHSKFPKQTTFMACYDTVYIINAWWWVISVNNWSRNACFKYPKRIWHLAKLKTLINLNNKNRTSLITRSRDEFVFISLDIL